MTTAPRKLIFSLAFCLTGVSTSLLGATLPAILHQWHLSDSRGGLLLLFAWGGSTSGALLARGNLSLRAPFGLALSSAALLALSLARSPLPALFYLLYGIGLGTAMTSISMLRSREVLPEQTDLELNRLNLYWALGAFVAPALALHSLHLLSVATLFRLMAVTLAVAAFVLWAVSGLTRQTPVPSPPGKTAASLTLAWAPLRFCLFAAASVGLESAVGSWLTTYAERLTLGVASAVSANTAFWAGLLLSRAAHSLAAVPWVHTRRVRSAHIVLTGLAILLLLFHPARDLLAIAGLLCGLGLGPLYPYVLSVSLPRYRSTAVFITAGVGASLVPWLTGVLSTAYDSLRIGFLAPAATFVLLVAAALRMRAELR